ncbi:hypothetical protein [Paracraurococcus ruber]|uniref:Uncharacterized protein n=1 Tax=Paracraurococcus ruber TaxID=77675 RepID=A0ABS1D299_9PROT|nr:hypothetical protein [Paracraurococcus ruber]MBK1660914.1 hypothetical protein [Paracraurococcus ruber]TDG30457.1 hypothetical protein E2C05_14460 [Paracraurococcus ruber]
MFRSLATGLLAAGLIAAPALAQRDGTPGNPPSTATQRTLDRATGSPPTPADGTPGNPPGTAAGRALDRATGSNTTGANPTHSTPASRERAQENRTGTTTHSR